MEVSRGHESDRAYDGEQDGDEHQMTAAQRPARRDLKPQCPRCPGRYRIV
jgi:hypothetical protein